MPSTTVKQEHEKHILSSQRLAVSAPHLAEKNNQYSVNDQSEGRGEFSDVRIRIETTSPRVGKGKDLSEQILSEQGESCRHSP